MMRKEIIHCLINGHASENQFNIRFLFIRSINLSFDLKERKYRTISITEIQSIECNQRLILKFNKNH